MTTEPTPEQTPGPADVEVPDTGDDVEVPDTIEAARKLRSENRSLRQRLHTAETERTAAEVLVDPSDVWRIDPELQQSFYDQEFGEISGDNVVSAAKKLAS